MADYDGDGRPDLISGSNCCDPLGLYYFPGTRGGLGPRREVFANFHNQRQRRWFNRGYTRFSAADWNGTLLVENFEYPFPALGILGDVTGDGLVGIADLLRVFQTWGTCPPQPAGCTADLDDDGAVGPADMIIVLGHWSS